MGVAYHGNYFAWFEVGRTDLLRSHGVSYKELEGQDLRLPVIEAHARFVRPALYDDVLEVRTQVTALSGARVTFAYEVCRGEDGVLATGTTSHARRRRPGAAEAASRTVEETPGLKHRNDRSTPRSWPRLAALGLATALAGCASSQGDLGSLASSSDEIVWQAAEKAFQKKQWESARKYYRRIIDGFPQSEHLPDARLALAETHFKEGGAGNYVLAVSEYREFLTLYPSHPKSDYAQYQTAESYYLQRNSPDRDQTNTTKALEEYERLLDVYPSSSHVEIARLRVANLRQYLAKAEFGAGYFYQRTRKAWRSAISRYELILSDYPDYAETDEVLYRLSECLVSAARKAEALPYLDRLTAEYTNGKFAAPARELMAELAQQGVTPPPPSSTQAPAAGPPPDPPTP